ncbi:MAG: hypothetical protein EOP04_32680, partial [Proteobacteria bacterium]
MISRQGIGAYGFQKILETLFSLFVLALIAFSFLHALPGGPFDEETPMNATVRQTLQHYWALDQPFFNQFFLFLKNIASGDFGNSMAQTGRTVLEILKSGASQT